MIRKAFCINLIQIPAILWSGFPPDPLSVRKVGEGYRHRTQSNGLLGKTSNCHPGGDIININYSWQEIDIYNEFDSYCEAKGTGGAAPDINPEDLDASDSVTFTWELA